MEIHQDNPVASQPEVTRLMYQTTLDTLDKIEPTKIDEIINKQNFETTSYDGKPFLTPMEFQEILKETPEFGKEITNLPLGSGNDVLKKRKLNALERNAGSDEKFSTYSSSETPFEGEKILKKTKSISFEVPARNFENCEILTSSTENKSPVEERSPAYQPTEKFILSEKKIENDTKVDITGLKLYSYSLSSREIKFKADLKDPDSGNESNKIYTRTQLLKLNPLKLLYYYEDNLVFGESNDLDVKNLVKI